MHVVRTAYRTEHILLLIVTGVVFASEMSSSGQPVAQQQLQQLVQLLCYCESFGRTDSSMLTTFLCPNRGDSNRRI